MTATQSAVRRSRLRLYAPFLALLLLQGMIMVLAPSAGEQQSAAFGDGDGEGGERDVTGQGDGAADPFAADGQAATTPDGELDAGDANAEVTDGAGDGRGAGQAGGAGGAANGGSADDANGGEQASSSPDGDTSHCTDDGRQHGAFHHAPPCEPASDGTNPGETWTGVTEDEILVVWKYNAPHPLLDAIIPTEISEQDQEDFHRAAEDFINDNYELHGRQLRIQSFRSNCPATPPNPAACREAARQAIEMEPFLVNWLGAPEIHDEYTRAGVMSIGGINVENNFLDQRRPFRYTVSMGGREAREHIGEYYCKKLAGGRADRTGDVIHPQIGERGELQRRWGLVTPDTPSSVANANALRDIVEDCDGYRPPLFTYELDIERGLEQATAVTAGLISEGVTTVTCLCDPVAPQFLTTEMTNQDYFPENLMMGTFAIDADPVGRIYDEDQWDRAFGPSSLVEPEPWEENVATAMWTATGREASDCVMCEQNPLVMGDYQLIGHLLQAGGAQLDPGTVEQGVFDYGGRGAWSETQDPHIGKREFGPDNRGWAQDMREVYWDPEAVSPHDGESGAYVAVDGGRRYEPGEWPDELDIPLP